MQDACPCQGEEGMREAAQETLALMRPGVRRMDRSFLCTHRKLISTIFMLASFARTSAGMALMKPASFLPAPSLRTPNSQSWQEPRGCSNQRRKSGE